MLKKVVIGSWFLVFGFLFLYSFTQVDLGLTLNRTSVISEIQKSFQYVGYFQRPLSTYLFISMSILIFVLYLWTLFLVHRKKLEKKTVWILVFLAAIILTFSYNAFSYDLFNYMFDARIVTKYGQNPYVTKALDFPQDPYLGFMHWTHRTYPYGPLWIGVTLPLSFMGMQIFILTFYLFKLLMVGSYLACAYLIYKIAKSTKLVDPVFALAFFALNPLVIVETLVSGHHDLIMMALSLFAAYLLIQKKYVSSGIFLLLSMGIKFATGFLTPLFIWFPFSKRKNKEFIFFFGCLIIMIIAVFAASFRTTFQPWYLLFAIPFCAILSNRNYVFVPTVVLSFLVLFQYIPYLYTGNFNFPVPILMNEMLLVSVLASIIITCGVLLLKKVKKS